MDYLDDEFNDNVENMDYEALDGFLSSTWKEIKRAGRKIDKNKEKIVVGAAIVAGAVVGGPAIVGALKTGAGAVASVAKSGVALVAQGGGIAKAGVVKLGQIIATPFTGLPEEVTQTQEVVESSAWYSKTFDYVKKGIELTTGLNLDSPEGKDLIDGLVSEERAKLLNNLGVVKQVAVNRVNARALAFIIFAKWLEGMSVAQQRSAKIVIDRYVNLSAELSPAQRAVYNKEIKSLVVAYLPLSPTQKLKGLREIDKITQIRLSKRIAMHRAKVEALREKDQGPGMFAGKGTGIGVALVIGAGLIYGLGPAKG